MRPVRALIRPADKYTIRDQTAGGGLSPRDALQLPPSYRSVKSILVHELDRLPQQHPAQPEDGQIHLRFPREHGYFNPTTPRRLLESQGHQHGRIGSPEARTGVRSGTPCQFRPASRFGPAMTTSSGLSMNDSLRVRDLGDRRAHFVGGPLERPLCRGKPSLVSS